MHDDFWSHYCNGLTSCKKMTIFNFMSCVCHCKRLICTKFRLDFVTGGSPLAALCTRWVSCWLSKKQSWSVIGITGTVTGTIITKYPLHVLSQPFPPHVMLPSSSVVSVNRELRNLIPVTWVFSSFYNYFQTFLRQCTNNNRPVLRRPHSHYIPQWCQAWPSTHAAAIHNWVIRQYSV